MRRNRFLIGFLAMLSLTPALAAAPICKTGELFAGAPDYADPSDRAKNKQGLLDVPPLGFRTLLFAGDRLVTAVGLELWSTDLSEAVPVLRRLAGREGGSGHHSLPGACGDARFGNISGIAMLPDGSIAGADQTANNLFLVTDPFGPDCTVTFIAGVTEPQPSLNPGHPARDGDADGPGGEALLRDPDWVATIGDAIYFIDSSNAKVKKVAADAAHTVTTIATLPEANFFEMIALDGKLYTVGNTNNSEGLLLEIDPATGKTHEIARGRAEFWMGGGSIDLSGLATDGTGLFTTQAGQVLYVTLDGEIDVLAGKGQMLEFSADYDPHAPHPAGDLELVSSRRVQTAGANVFLAYRDGQIYFSAAATSPYVERIACK